MKQQPSNAPIRNQTRGTRMPIPVLSQPQAISTNEALDALRSSPHGLSRAEAAARLERYGPNTLPRSLPPRFIRVFNSRSETRSAFLHNPLCNPLLLFGTVAAQLIHICSMHTPWISDVLRVQPVSLDHWLELLGLALIILVTMELHKAGRYGQTANNCSARRVTGRAVEKEVCL